MFYQHMTWCGKVLRAVEQVPEDVLLNFGGHEILTTGGSKANEKLDDLFMDDSCDVPATDLTAELHLTIMSSQRLDSISSICLHYSSVRKICLRDDRCALCSSIPISM